VFETPAEAHIARLNDLIYEVSTLPPGSEGRVNRFCAALEARELVRRCKAMHEVEDTFIRHANLEDSMVLTDSGLKVTNWE
jgi:hypothetical protein